MISVFIKLNIAESILITLIIMSVCLFVWMGGEVYPQTVRT